MADPGATMEWRLRDYRIQAEHFEEFVQAWTAGVLPLRRQFGFRVLAWSLPQESRFVWFVGYPGPDSFDEADARYYDSPERAAVTPEPAQWVLEKRDATVTPVAMEEAP